MEIRIVAPCGNLVGESPVWCERTQSLFWVDIAARQILRWRQVDRSLSRWHLPELVTSIGLRKDGGAIVGMKRRIVLWDFDHQYKSLACPEPAAYQNRLNEGKVGPDGHYWVGTMQNNLDDSGEEIPISGKLGRIYRVDPMGDIQMVVPTPFAIPNGFVWVGDVFLASDSDDNTTYAYEITKSRLGRHIPFGEAFSAGRPDGACVDTEGYVWSCRTGGSCIVRFSPGGVLDRVVELPCLQPTSCAFGGPELQTLFITTSRFGLNDRQTRFNPTEGALLAFEPGVCGYPTARFG